MASTESDAIVANNRISGEELGSRALSMRAMPQFIELETTTRCNQDCLMCPREPGPAGEDVPDWVVEALGPCWPGLQNLSLHGLGEPLMARCTDSIVASLPEGTHVWFSSNLQILNQRHLDLFKHRKGAVSCSLDAATQDTYALVRGGELRRSLDNIRRLREETDLRVFINMTVMKINYREVGAFLNIARDLGVDKVVLLRLNEGESFATRRRRGDFVFEYDEQHLGEEDAGDVARQIRDHPVPIPVEDMVNLCVHSSESTQTLLEQSTGDVALVNPHQDVLCHMPWTNLNVQIDGSIRVCCHHEALANLGERDVTQVWNGPELRAIRDAISNEMLHPLCHRDNCPIYRAWHLRTRPPSGLVRRYVRTAGRVLAPLRRTARVLQAVAEERTDRDGRT